MRAADVLRSAATALLTALAACKQPQPIVICHNANCGEPTDPARDDTLPALRDSLALVDDTGRPIIDGMEIDSFFRAADSACLYAHDPSDFAENTPATAPAMEIAAHFAEPGQLTFAGTPFHVLHELKAYVSANTQDRHTPAELDLHAQCAWQVYAIISDAAVANNRDVEFEFESFSPEVLRAVIADTPASTPTPYTFGAIQGVPSPLDDQTRPLRDYTGLPISVVDVHPQWLLDAQYEAIQTAHEDLAFFWFSTTEEIFALIRQYEPVAVDTSEARLMRRWLER
jgi:hypothetical protein